MKLEYSNSKDGGRVVLTDFDCGPSQHLLSEKGLYKIVWAKAGNLEISVDGSNLNIEKDQVIFCTPLNIMETKGNPGILALVFNREFYCIRDHDEEVSCNGFLFFGSPIPPIISLCDKDLASFEAMFFMLKEEFATNDHIQGEMLRVVLKRLLIKASRLLRLELPGMDIPTPKFDMVRRFHILVEQHFKEKHAVSEYADMLYKSPKTLSNLFKKSGDRSPLKIINDRIILEAKRLLFYSDKTAEEISYELGFKESAHFSKFFKSHTGHPPGTFKKKFKESN